MKKIILLSNLLFVSVLIFGQTITISGQYLDKKQNPINNATVSYYQNGTSLVGSATTTADGTFTMQVNITSIAENNKVLIHPASPNPFNKFTSFSIKVTSPGQLSIINMKGEFIDGIRLDKSGVYQCTWGGQNRNGEQVSNGSYIIIVSGEDYSTSTKVIYNPLAGDAYALKTMLVNDKTYERSRDTDIIRFTRNNTTTLDLTLNMPAGDTTLGIINGNPGPETLSNIDENHFTIQTPLFWNLNQYFYNDDQSLYEAGQGNGFAIIQDTVLQFNAAEPGNYSDFVIATDMHDLTLQAELTANVELQYTLLIQDQEIIEDTDQMTLIEDLNTFKNPAYEQELTYEIISQSNTELINLVIDGSAIVINNLQVDGYGTSNVEIKATSNSNSDTVYFDVNVLARPDMTGTINNLFDATAIGGAEITIDENGFMHNITADENGNYHIQFNSNVDETTHYPVTITHDNYTPFHTWITVEPEEPFLFIMNAVEKVMIKKKNGKRKKFKNIRNKTRADKFETAYIHSGILLDKQSGLPISGAIITFEDPTGDVSDTTNSNGEYEVEIITIDYIPVLIEHSSHTMFHTWYDNIAGSGTMDFEMIPDDFVWDLYEEAFRDTTGLNPEGIATIRWYDKAIVHIFSDNSLVGGTDITANYDNMMYNLENILPTFDDVEFDFDDVVEHTTFGYQMQDGEMGVYWDNSISGAGQVIIMKSGPIILKCSTSYKDWIDPNDPDNSVYNQELGSCFGAVNEPAQSSTYTSVFTDPAGWETYTPDDLNSSNVRLTRTPIHYLNQDYANDNPEGWDWEAHPETVEQYFGPGKKQIENNIEYIVRYYDYDGSISQFKYTPKTIPSSVMKQFPLIFTKEEILKRISEETTSIGTITKVSSVTTTTTK